MGSQKINEQDDRVQDKYGERIDTAKNQFAWTRQPNPFYRKRHQQKDNMNKENRHVKHGKGQKSDSAAIGTECSHDDG